jgi:uncharacterized membrane protein YeiH
VSDAHVTAAIQMLVLALDLLGTFAFAISGGVAGVKRRHDFFGIMVLAFAAGNAGGITRDLLIGAVPPDAISDWRYLAISVAAGIATFYGHRVIERMRSSVQVFDAAGLALFAVSGSAKALAFGVNPAMAAVLGMLTGIGGGMLRDLLVGEVPAVLRSEVYAIAALAGAAVVVIGYFLRFPSAIAAIAGAILCFGIRMFAIRRSWNLPRARSSPPSSPEVRSET